MIGAAFRLASSASRQETLAMMGALAVAMAAAMAASRSLAFFCSAINCSCVCSVSWI